MLAQAQQADAAAPIDLAPDTVVDALPERRRVQVRGEFVADRQGLLDNQVRDGLVGYDVLTPLRVDGRATLLLVDRGWLARGARRSNVPHWQTPSGAVTLTGYLYTPANVPLVTGDVADTFGGSWVVLEIDPGALRTVAGGPLEPRVLRLGQESEFGFRRDWPVVSMTPQRHYAYAMQWFGMAIALLVIYVLSGRRSARVLAMKQESQ